MENLYPNLSQQHILKKFKERTTSKFPRMVMRLPGKTGMDITGASE
jgi:hypothetical protein